MLDKFFFVWYIWYHRFFPLIYLFKQQWKKIGNSHKNPNAYKRGGKARGQEQRTGWSYCFYTREAESEKEGELGYKQRLPCLLTSSNTVPQQKGAATFPNMNANWVTSVQTQEPKEGHCLFELQHSTPGPQRLGAIS